MEMSQAEAPEVSKAFDELIKAIVASKGLDTKTKQLIYIAIKTSYGDTNAVIAHIPMAGKLGVPKREWSMQFL